MLQKLYIATIFLLEAIEKEDFDEISHLVTEREIIFNDVKNSLKAKNLNEKDEIINKILEKNKEVIEKLEKLELKINTKKIDPLHIKKAFYSYGSYSKIS